MGNVQYDFKNKLVMVSAGGKGIGRAIVDSFLESGAMVASFSRSIEETRQDNLLLMKGDINDHNFLEIFHREVVGHFIQDVDILVNNNGGPPPGLALSFDDQDWLEAIQNNFMSTLQMIRLVVDGMKVNEWGRIINLTSASAKEPAAGMALSNVTRASVASLSKTLSISLGGDGITVNTILTGGVKTERFDSLVENQIEETGETFNEAMKRINATLPVNFIATPEQFSRYILFLASDDASYLTGASISIDGGASKSLF